MRSTGGPAKADYTAGANIIGRGCALPLQPHQHHGRGINQHSEDARFRAKRATNEPLRLAEHSRQQPSGLGEAADIKAEQGALGPVPAEVNAEGQGQSPASAVIVVSSCRRQGTPSTGARSAAAHAFVMGAAASAWAMGSTAGIDSTKALPGRGTSIGTCR